jgi:hypothetical protein
MNLKIKLINHNYNNNMTYKIINNIKVLVIAFAIALGANVAFSAWSTAPANPPSNNTDAPINVGYGGQVKLGSLSLNSYLDSSTLGAYGLIVNNAPIKAAGGFVVETRSADPSNPETGRMWLINQ